MKNFDIIDIDNIDSYHGWAYIIKGFKIWVSNFAATF